MFEGQSKQGTALFCSSRVVFESSALLVDQICAFIPTLIVLRGENESTCPPQTTLKGYRYL